MKYIVSTVILSMIFSIGFCQKIETTTIKKPFSISKQDMLCKKWRLFQSIYIPDVIGQSVDTTTFPLNAKPEQIWIFRKDKTYIKYTKSTGGIHPNDDKTNIEEGQWSFNQDSTKIGIRVLKYLNSDGQITNINNTNSIDYDHMYFSKLTSTELIFTAPRGSGYAVYIPLINND